MSDSLSIDAQGHFAQAWHNHRSYLLNPAYQPVILAFAQRRLFAMFALTLRDSRIVKVEATVDPSARFAADLDRTHS